MSTRQEKIDLLLRREADNAQAGADPVGGMVAPTQPQPQPAPQGQRGQSSPPPSPSTGGGSRGAGQNRGATPPASSSGAAVRDVAQGLRDAPGAIVRGAAGAVNQTLKLAEPLDKWMKDNGLEIPGYLAIGGPDGFIKWHRQYPEGAPIGVNPTALPKKSESVTGQAIESISQFTVGMLGAGKLLKPLKLGVIAGGAAKGAIADFTVMDPYEKRLSNIISENSELAKPITDFLAADENDPMMVARLKNVVEGAGLGIATDAFVASLRLLKNTRLLKSAPRETSKALLEEHDRIIKEVEAALNKSEKGAKFKVAQNPDGTWAIETNLTAEQKAAVQTHTANSSDAKRLHKAARSLQDTEVSLGKFDHQQLENAEELRKAVSEAAPNTIELHRGMSVPKDSEIYKKLTADESFTLGPSSFSEDPDIAEHFSFGQLGNARVELKLESGAQAVKVGKGLTNLPQQKEWISAGQFEVTSKVVNQDGSIQATIKQVPSESTTSLASKYPRTFKTKSEAVSEAATLNMVDQEARKAQPKGKLTQQQKDTLVAQAAHLADPDNPWMGKTAGIDFNFTNIAGEEDAKVWIEALSQTMRPEIDKLRGGSYRSNASLLRQIGDMFPDGNPEDILSNLGRLYENTRDMEAHLNAGRVLLNSIGNQVSEISKLVDGDPTNTIQLGRLAASLDSLFYVGSRTKGVITTTARTLQSLSMDTAEVAASMAKKAGQQAPKTASQEVANALGGQESLLMQKLITALPSMTPDTVRGLARKIRLAEGDPSVILKTIKVIRDADPEEIVQPGFWDYVNTVWVNSVLSGPLTTMQNLLGTATAVIQTPAERYFTGMIARDKKIREEATDTFVGYVASLGDAWTAGWKALKENRNALDPEYMVNEFKSPIQGYLGAVVNAPSRFLMSQDEFFKNLGYRANVRSQALREARDLGMTSDKAAEYVENAVKAAFDPDGRGVNNQALDFSRYVTFTQPLREGSFSKSLQEMMGRHPALRFAALPFVRTPANLLTWNWERTPLIGLLAKSNREALAAGGPRAAEVMAKQSTGAMIWGGASYLALSGMITGNGPGDPELRKQWLTTHQPYSVKVGGQWVAYRRADPLLAPFGIVADVVSSSGEIPWDGIDDTAVAFVAAMTRNISSKSYMYGLTEFMNAAFKGDELTINRYLQGKVASFVPSAVNQLNPDDELHELRGYVDTVMARIPGVSDKLPARRNIFGEKVLKAPFYPNRALNIFTMSPADDDPVMDKLTELGRAIPFPSKTAPGTSIDMTSRAYGTKIVDGEEQTPYDRMMAIMASPGRGTPSLREVITGIVNSPQWDQMSPGVPGVQEGGTRFDVVNKVVQEYREMARARVMAEFPELRKAVQQAQITEEVAKRGGKEGLERVLRFFDPQ